MKISFTYPLARKFNLLKYFGNIFMKLREELNEENKIECPPEGQFYSCLFRSMSIQTKAAILFVATTIIPGYVFFAFYRHTPVYVHFSFLVLAMDYFIACLETYDEEPKGDE